MTILHKKSRKYYHAFCVTRLRVAIPLVLKLRHFNTEYEQLKLTHKNILSLNLNLLINFVRFELFKVVFPCIYVLVTTAETGAHNRVYYHVQCVFLLSQPFNCLYQIHLILITTIVRMMTWRMETELEDTKTKPISIRLLHNCCFINFHMFSGNISNEILM